MRLLFIGESWLGSCARSLKEALARRADVDLDEVNEDSWFPRPRARWLRALNRLIAPAYRRDFNAHVLDKVRTLRPSVVMTYKGTPIRAGLVTAIRALGAFTVNVYPDCSPHAHGAAHQKAVGAYDLVVSTKAFHPSLWKQTYGYENRCLFVPQGYDPNLHFVSEPPSGFEFDVVMVATCRPEYGRLLVDLARALDDPKLRVAIGGFGWDGARTGLPRHWVFPGPVQGRGYLALLRKGRICIAPLTREVVIDGQHQPGDVDTTRSYELAAAHCFFLHRRTDFARSLYAEDEVPMYESAEELAGLIGHYLARDVERARMAAAAHRRAVPAYSLDDRAGDIMEVLKRELRAIERY
jgi:glycosyltransferase involved in cell wall biosynthesis